MKHDSASSGFSLVEVLCAIAILGIGFAGLVQGVTTALNSSRDSEIQTTVALLAAGQMEKLRADGFLVAGETTGEWSEPFSRFRWRQTISRSAIDGLFDVQIAVEQAVSGKTLLQLDTMLFDSSGSSSGAAPREPPSGRQRRGGTDQP